MSTHISTSNDPDAQEPISEQELYTFFEDGAKPKNRWRIGGEFEKFALDRTTGRQISYSEPDGVCDILQLLVNRFGWTPHYEDRDLTTLTRNGSTISLEPGNQVEFSTSPVQTIGQLAEELLTHVQEIQTITDRNRLAWVGLGVTPACPIEQIPIGPRNRHAVMSEYLPQKGPLALHMMKATASTQVTFDFENESDAIRKFVTALKLSPIANTIWANSRFYAGEDMGCVSYRGRIWEGMDPDRSGFLEDLLHEGFSFTRWTQYLLEVPLLFEVFNGEYLPAKGRTFREFITKGFDGRFPTRSDWEFHITTVFPEVRLKQFLEIRGADATPPPLALGVPAFWKGILYDEQALAAAEELAFGIPSHALKSLANESHQSGLETVFHGRKLADWVKQLVQISSDGLKRQAEQLGTADERPYLDPIHERLNAHELPISWVAAVAANEYPRVVIP